MGVIICFGLQFDFFKITALPFSPLSYSHLRFWAQNTFLFNPLTNASLMFSTSLSFHDFKKMQKGNGICAVPNLRGISSFTSFFFLVWEIIKACYNNISREWIYGIPLPPFLLGIWIGLLLLLQSTLNLEVNSSLEINWWRGGAKRVNKIKIACEIYWNFHKEPYEGEKIWRAQKEENAENKQPINEVNSFAKDQAKLFSQKYFGMRRV